MLIRNFFILNKSHSQLTRDFFRLFDCTHLPSHSQLVSFLEKNELTCFLKKEAKIKPLIKVDVADHVERQIFLLPVDVNLSDSFIEHLSRYLKEVSCPVILYWVWKLPENKGYVALRITIEQLSKVIQLKTEILNLAESYFVISPITQLIEKLKIHLTDYQVIANDNLNSNEPIIGDELYWTALTMFLKLTQEDLERYLYDFKIWYQENKPLSHRSEERLLNFVPYVHTNLFCFEQGIAILQIDFLQQLRSKLIERYCLTTSLLFQNLSDEFIPAQIKNISLTNALRIITLCGIFYESNYITFGHFTLVFLLNHLMSRIKKNAPEGFTRLALFYGCQLFSTACHLAFNLYAVIPGNAAQRDIIAPRYIFQWMTIMIKESIKLPIYLIGMMLLFGIFFLAEKLFHMPIMNTSNNQNGFRSIAFFVMQFFISFFEKSLFQFDRWIFPQTSEEVALSHIHRGCDKPCGFEIKEWAISRVLRKIFFDSEIVNYEIRRRNEITKCTLQLTHDFSKTCTDYQLQCESRFFMSCSDNTTVISALAHQPVTRVHSMQIAKFCQ